MAVKGTKIPNDAGRVNVIPSVPSPNQLPGSEAYDASRVGYPDSRSITNEDPVSTTSNVNGPSGPESPSNLRRRNAGDHHAAADNLALGGFRNT